MQPQLSHAYLHSNQPAMAMRKTTEFCSLKAHVFDFFFSMIWKEYLFEIRWQQLWTVQQTLAALTLAGIIKHLKNPNIWQVQISMNILYGICRLRYLTFDISWWKRHTNNSSTNIPRFIMPVITTVEVWRHNMKQKSYTIGVESKWGRMTASYVSSEMPCSRYNAMLWCTNLKGENHKHWADSTYKW